MRLLAKECPPIVAGESGVAGLAGAILVAQDDEARVKVGLTAESRILTIGTEGATDAAVYERLVGAPP
jgi:diaminopropionate ammonia-lyase